MVCAVCSAPSLSTPAQSEPPPPSDSANQLPCQLVVSVEGFLSRADVRDLVERRREAARIRSGYYDDRPTWQRPVW